MQINFNNKVLDVKIMKTEEQIKERVKELARKINDDLGIHEPLVILIVLNGSFIFAADLVRNLQMPTQIETIRLTSYEGLKSSGHVIPVSPLPDSLVDKNVLIIEDIVDTGRSLRFLMQYLLDKKVK